MSKPDARKYPLRRIVGLFSIDGTGITKEQLECGHVLSPHEDIIGPTSPEQRRCWKCEKGLPPDEPPEKEFQKQIEKQIESVVQVNGMLLPNPDTPLQRHVRRTTKQKKNSKLSRGKHFGGKGKST